ncbi:MAG: hypothetical protein VKL00_00680 [Synechococcales bacterium]|nr:hypothetical protein [Cyanobacteria bacterium REEB444]MEB3124155.1 hypothetical protein [Synechococcales bacterium]
MGSPKQVRIGISWGMGANLQNWDVLGGGLRPHVGVLPLRPFLNHYLFTTTLF